MGIAKDEWVGMPEYTLRQHKPFRTLKINFETEADVEAFAALIGQKIYPKRENYWFPAWHESMYSNQVYVDEP